MRFDTGLRDNFLLKTDSYKIGHAPQYPVGTQYIESYGECRKGSLFSLFPFVGLQGIIKNNFVGEVLNQTMLDQAVPLFKAHFGNEAVFYVNGWNTMLREHKGKLPLRIRALPEGTLAKPGVALFKTINTDPRFPFLTNVAETVLMHYWFPTTVAALGYAVKNRIKQYLETTGCDVAGLPFMLHDFGFRGTSSVESAAIGGCAHLVNFLGTDTLAGMAYAHDNYNADIEGLAYSVPATEHSVMTASGREGEIPLVGRLLDLHATGILSLVIDSYDPYKFARTIIGEIYKEKVLARDGVVVLRPDSITPQHPTPEAEMVGLCDILWEKFGGAINAAGYKVLDPHVRLLWGDGIDIDGINLILDAMMRAGYAACNVATFGMGGGLLQKINRDTQRCAIKASAICDADGVWHDQYKEPLDQSKKSLRGRLKTIRRNGELVTVREEEDGLDLFQTIFENGELLIDENFADIRARATL